MGEPTCSNVQVSITESIGYEKETRGTETSKYPQEEKETSIFKVAASEMERGQTGIYSGVADHQKAEESIGEDVWKGVPKEVRVPYPKCFQSEMTPE